MAEFSEGDLSRFSKLFAALGPAARQALMSRSSMRQFEGGRGAVPGG